MNVKLIDTCVKKNKTVGSNTFLTKLMLSRFTCIIKHQKIALTLVVTYIFPAPCHLDPKGPSSKGVLINFVHVHKKYKTRVGNRRCLNQIFVEY